MSARALLRGTALVAALSLAFPALATKITIVNKDTAGVGFNDTTARAPVGGNNGTTLGAQRLNVFKYAADFWSSQIDSPVEILVQASFEAKACTSTTATLGSAGTRYIFSDFKGAPRAGTWYSSALANKLAGEDLNPPSSDDTGEDIQASFTTALDDGSCAFPKKWYYGLDAQPPAGTTDFATVIIHELGHGLGFQTFVSRTTGKRFAGSDGVGLDDGFMVFLYDGSTGKTWDKMTDDERLTSITNTGSLLWNGATVTAVASSVLTAGTGVGGRALMYAPNPSESGSSTSHWDTSLSPNEIMEPTYTRAIHSLLVTGQLMKDLGWGLASGSTTYDYFLPSSAKAPGKGGAYYSTALSIGNRGAAQANYTIQFLGHDVDGTAGQVSSPFVLGPNQSVTYNDVLGSVFGQGDGSYGAIRVSSSVNTLSVTGQTSTPDPTKPGGTFGQSVPAFGASDVLTAGSVRSIVGIREDSSFRTNLVLVNTGSSPVTISGTLFSTSGATLGTKSWTLPAFGMTQDGPIVPNMGVTGSVRDAQLVLSTPTTGGSFAAYAAVIDNVTNDPRTLLPK